MNAKVLLGIAKQGPVYIRAMRSLPVFSEEDCRGSDTDNIPTLLHYAPVENSSSVSEENQQSQQQMDRREVNRTNNAVCSGILTPQSSDSRPVLVVEPQTAQGSDSALIPVLKDMFPTKSDADINEVITSVQGNLDAAIESLLDQNNIVLDEHGASKFNEELLSLRSVQSPGIALQQYRNQMINGGLRHYININRNSQTLFRDIVGIYKRARDDLRKKPDVTFEGEEGVDAGGPTLEFLWLALSQMRQGDGGKVSLFEGSSGHLLPVHCTSYLDSGLFYVFGKVVAHSILHGGTGFPGLSPAMGRFIASGDVDSASSLVSAEDIPDIEYKDVIEKILGAKTADDIQQLSSNPQVQVMLDNAGFTGVFLSLENKEIAANQIMVHEVLNKRRREVEDIRRGLESLALVSLLSTCSSLCNQIFPPSQEFGINPEMVKSQITLMEGEVLNSENKRNAFLWLQSYIEELGVRTKKTGTYHGSQGLEQGPMVISNSANHTTAVISNETKPEQAAQSTSDDAPGLAEFCQFVSGTPVPPQQPIRVRFSTDDKQTLPVAETCFMWLVLPVTSSCFQEFKKNMDIALKFEATGFYIM